MYKQMYLILFNAVSDAVDVLLDLNVHEALVCLMKAQMEVEEIYISASSDEPSDQE